MEKMEALKLVRSFLSKHGSSRFEVLEYNMASGNDTWAPKPDQRVHNRAGWYRPEGHGCDEAYIISADAWASEVVTGMDPMRAARVLKGIGLLECDEDRLAKKLPRGIGGGSGRAYFVLATALGAGEEAGNSVDEEKNDA